MRKYAIGFPLTALIVLVLSPSYTLASDWGNGDVPEDYVDVKLAKKAALYIYYTDVCEDRSFADPNITPKILGEPIEFYVFCKGDIKVRPYYIITLYIGDGDISTEDLDNAAKEELELAKPYLTLGPGRKWSDSSKKEVGREALNDVFYGSLGDRYDFYTIWIRSTKYGPITGGQGPGVSFVLRGKVKLEYIAEQYLDEGDLIGGRYFTINGINYGREFITEDGRKIYVQHDLEYNDCYIYTEDDPPPNPYELSESEAPDYDEWYFEWWKEVERSDYEPDSFMSD